MASDFPFVLISFYVLHPIVLGLCLSEEVLKEYWKAERAFFG